MIPIPILTYHSISAGASRAFRAFTVSPQRLASHLDAIRAHGYAPITVSELSAAMHRRGAGLPSKPVVITFDDGFADFLHQALPVLSTHRCRATLYVVAGFGGSTSRWLRNTDDAGMPLLTWEELEEVSRQGIEIGAHSMTHTALDALPVRRAQDEIRASKALIEDRLGREVKSFAYPYGFYNAAVRDLVVDAGYDAACAVRHGTSALDDDRFALARHIVPPAAGEKEIAALLEGRAPWLPMMAKRARSSAWAVMRRSLRPRDAERSGV